jgi:hypothetical protein
LLKVFKQCLPFLTPETIPELKIEMNEQKAQLINTESKFKTQQSEIEELKKAIEGLYHLQGTYPQTLKHTLLNRKTGKMEEYSETVSNPQEEKESLMRFQEKIKKLSEPLKDNEKRQVFEV